MELKLTGLTALVTGASRGIGFAVAQELAREGCNLHLVARTAADLEAARSNIAQQHKVSVQCHALDLSESRNIGALAQRCGEIDILVVHPALPAHSLQELIALARARPGELTYATSGTGTVSHLLTEWLRLSDVRERLATQGAEPVGNTPEEYAVAIKADLARWAKVVTAAGIRAD